MKDGLYVLSMQDDGGSTHQITFEERPDEPDIYSEIEDWVKDGEWGNDGASIPVSWSLEFNDKEIDSGFYDMEIEPNHEKLITEACGYYWDEGGKTIKGCGSSPDDHDWTAEGEGGCDENPGVWSTGGTSMTFSTHCRICGLKRVEYTTGSQKNPNEHDTVSYEMPDEDEK